MDIIESFLTRNDCYKQGKKLKLEGLMLHSVACPQPKASVFIKSWNRSGIKKCVHAFIDAKNGYVYQTLPWLMRGWHGGKKYSNDHYIGVEMCEPSSIEYTGGSSFKMKDPAHALSQIKTAYDSAVELFAFLCFKYNLKPSSICSHREGHAKGIASNHGDPEHLWRCSGFGKTMNDFRADVAREIQKQKGGDEVTQEDFNKMMNTYLEERSKEPKSDWVNANDAAGIMHGDADGAMRWRSFVTREEAVTMIARAIKKEKV